MILNGSWATLPLLDFAPDLGYFRIEGDPTGTANRRLRYPRFVPFEYRVTKYDPALRDGRGAYIADDWTSVKDVGRAFGGVVLTDAEYRRVERAYIDSAVAFLREGGLNSLTVKGLENPKEVALEVDEGSVLSLERLGDVIRKILREEFWCRLECSDGFAHFGWDYYMYIGVPHRCPKAEHLAEGLGLYPEEFASPYKEEP